MEATENLSVEDMLKILSKSEKGLSSRAKKLGIKVTDLRKYLASEILRQIKLMSNQLSKQTLSSTPLRQGEDVVLSRSSFCSLNHLVDAQKALIDVLTRPPRSKDILAPLPPLGPGPSLNARTSTFNQRTFEMYMMDNNNIRPDKTGGLSFRPLPTLDPEFLTLNRQQPQSTKKESSKEGPSARSKKEEEED